MPVEELKGDRRDVFPLHTWEPRAEAGITPYQELTEPEILTRDEWPHQNSLWKLIVWYWRSMQWKREFSEEDEARPGGKLHALAPFGFRLQSCNNGKSHEKLES